MYAVLPGAWKGEGWMKFSAVATTLIELGGATPTTPSAVLSAQIATLASGIPQNIAKTDFHEDVRVKHAVVKVLSGGVRKADDGSDPTAALGALADGSTDTTGWIFQNSRKNIHDLKLYVTADAVIEIELYS